MELIYATNIAASAILLLWPLWFSRRYLRLRGFDPFVITTLVGLPIQLMRLFGGPVVLIEEGLFDPAYQYALLMGNLQTVAQTIGLVGFFGAFGAFRVDRSLPCQTVALSSQELRRGADLFLILFATTFYLLASAEFGLLNWLANPRLGYQLYRAGQGHWYGLAITSLSTSFLLRFLAAPRPKPLIAWACVYFSLSLLLGSKGVLLAYFVALLIFLWLIGWKHLTRFFLLGAPVIFMIMIGNLYLALSDGFELASIMEYFDYYKIAADYYRGILSGEIHLFFGEVSITSFWAYVPRAFWPDKPIVYGVLHVNEIFFPGQAELTNTPEFGGAVEQYADFGVLGVLVFSLLSPKSIALALMSYLIFKRPGVRVNHVTLATVGLMLMQFAPAFGQFFPGALLLLLLITVLLLVAAMRTRRGLRRGGFASA
jgi:hypothetical protein